MDVAVTSQRLTLHALSRLLKAMADYAYEHPTVTRLDELVDEVAREHVLTLTDEQVGQVCGAVSMVTPGAGTVRPTRPGEAVEPAAVFTILACSSDPLSALLWNTWRLVVTAAKAEPPELLLMESGGLLVPDPRDKDLEGLSIAELVFLVAHDRIDGRELLSRRALACGVGAALLAELLLRELITVDLVTHQVLAEGEAARTVPGITAPVRQALAEIQAGRHTVLGEWLTEFSTSGYTAIRRRLVDERVVLCRERGRFQKKTCFVPAGEVIDSIFRVATRPLAVGRMPTPPCAMVIELAKATRLTNARYGEWIHVHHIDPGASLEGVAGRDRLELLLALTRAEVAELLSRP